MNRMFAFIAGIFLVFIGFSMQNRGASAQSARGLVMQETPSEQKIRSLSETVAPILMLTGAALFLGGLWLQIRDSRKRAN